MAMSTGRYKLALTAGPPSPEYWPSPMDALPATVVMMPVMASTWERGIISLGQ